ADVFVQVGGGIRVGQVAGVQTCALPISGGVAALPLVGEGGCRVAGPGAGGGGQRLPLLRGAGDRRRARVGRGGVGGGDRRGRSRSEGRRVGEGCGGRGAAEGWCGRRGGW